MSLLARAIERANTLARPAEGWRARKYLCPAGVWTQGFGHTGKGLTDAPWSLAKGERVLSADMEVYARAVLALSPNLARLPPEVLGALADFAFNLGTTRYKASTLRRRVAAEDWNEVARELRKWVYGGGRKLRGLVVRRAAEAAMILDAIAANENRAPAGEDLANQVREVLAAGGDVRGNLLKLLQGQAARAA